MKRSFMPEHLGKAGAAYARMAIFIAVLVAAMWDQSARLCRPGGRLRIWAGCRVIFPRLFWVFSRKHEQTGAIAGMMAGFLFTAGYIIYFKSLNPQWITHKAGCWDLTRGYRHVGTLINLTVAWLVASFTPEPPEECRPSLKKSDFPEKPSTLVAQHAASASVRSPSTLPPWISFPCA